MKEIKVALIEGKPPCGPAALVYRDHAPLDPSNHKHALAIKLCEDSAFAIKCCNQELDQPKSEPDMTNVVAQCDRDKAKAAADYKQRLIDKQRQLEYDIHKIKFDMDIARTRRLQMCQAWFRWLPSRREKLRLWDAYLMDLSYDLIKNESLLAAVTEKLQEIK